MRTGISQLPVAVNIYPKAIDIIVDPNWPAIPIAPATAPEFCPPMSAEVAQETGKVKSLNAKPKANTIIETVGSRRKVDVNMQQPDITNPNMPTDLRPHLSPFLRAMKSDKNPPLKHPIVPKINGNEAKKAMCASSTPLPFFRYLGIQER